MNPIEPTGTLSGLLAAVETIMVGLPAWQAWCGGVDQVARQTFLIAAPQSTCTKPRCIISHSGAFAQTRDGIHEGVYVQAAGVLLYLSTPTPIDTAATPPAPYGPRDSMIDFLNKVDSVLAGIWAVPSRGGYMPVLDNVELMNGPSRIQDTERDKYGDFHEILVSLQFKTWAP